MKTDPPHILCVNPWIHDFAAFDFWLKPLGLLGLAAILRENGCRVTFLDCLDRFHARETSPVKTGRDGRGAFRKTPIRIEDALPPLDGPLPDIELTFSRYGILPQWFEQDLKETPRPDLILVTSLMTYWASGAAETIACIRSVFPDVPIVLGGKYASLCQDHARRYSGADRIISGHGEKGLPALVRDVTGHDLTMPKDLDTAPFPALDLCSHLPYAPVLTSRGCPFSCDYCASSFLEPELSRRSPDRVFREIRHWHDRYGVKNFAFYDDALLVKGPAYAYPLLEKIIAAGLDLSFHTPNALHIREISPKAAGLMFRAGFKTIRLGLETADFSDHRRHDQKVRAREFSRAVGALKDAGFDRSQVGAYLLCGLPGQDLNQVEASVRFVKAAGILPVLAYFTPIPHTPMWDSAVCRARFDITRHPVFTNNSLFPCVTSRADIRRISLLKNL